MEPSLAWVALLQAGIVVALFVALRRGNAAAAINAVVSLGVALLPVALGVAGPFVFGRTVVVPAALPLWLAVAGLLHSIGMLGPYNTVWWWDHLTHTVSAAFVAALIYAGLLVIAREPGAVVASPVSIALWTVLYTFAAGVLWELIELGARYLGERYDVEPVLVHYGWRDTALDLVFDLVGALLVVLLDVRALVPFLEQFRPPADALVVGGTATLVGGTVLLALAFRIDGRR